MTDLTFDSPFPEGVVYVIGQSEKTGCSTVARLAQTDTNIVADFGCVEHEKELFLEQLYPGVQILYVYRGESQIPDWLIELTAETALISVNYDELLYTDETWELMQTDHDLLLALEALLPEDSPIRQTRDAIRAKHKAFAEAMSPEFQR